MAVLTQCYEEHIESVGIVDCKASPIFDNKPEGWSNLTGPSSPTMSDSSGVAALADRAATHEEKKRLSNLVMAFWKRALDGVRCQQIDSSRGVGGRLLKTQFSLDRQPRHITLKNEATGSAEQIPLHEIGDIYYVAADGEAAFPEALMSWLPDYQKSRLLMLERRNGGGKVCMLCETQEETIEFHTSLKILCLFAQNRSGARPSTPQRTVRGQSTEEILLTS